MSRFESLVIDAVVRGLPLEEAERAARITLYGYDTARAGEVGDE